MSLIPDTHRSLLEGPIDVILTTIFKTGFPHSTPIWCGYDGNYLQLNTGANYQKARNIARNPNVSVFVFDPKRPEKWISISGIAELVSEEAIDHLNGLCYQYTGMKDFFKDLKPELECEKRVIIKIKPFKVYVG